MEEMANMVQNLEDVISEMAQMQRSLPPRPSLDQIDSAQRLVVSVDSALAGRLETIILQPRPASIPQPVFRAYQEMKEDVLRCQAQAEKRMPSAVLELEERHRRFDALLLKVHACLASTQSPSSNGAGPSSANGPPTNTLADLGAVLDEKILQKHGIFEGKPIALDSVPELPSKQEIFNANHRALDLAVPASRILNGNLSIDSVSKASPADVVGGKHGYGAMSQNLAASPNTVAAAPPGQVVPPLSPAVSGMCC